ncbi:pseudouridine synthase [Muriicola soli]|uniref:Pseudouridine synthase n=1 Tax=Muriicola soli TaxID=2507538 RepID=A0A411EBK6_9FLAO|nr:pseudouridine synthase [Muriicola soli]QBA65049.1 rRNA pseudouridine synthase [Muriicola soli]
MSRSDYKNEGKSSGRGAGNFRKKSYARGNAPIKKKRENTPASDPNLIRLNKYVANAGVCSRREADTYIAAGNVTVNGKTITEMGFKVNRTDEVRFDGRLLNPEKKEYVLLNKPKNFITTTRDEKGRRTVMELISNATKARLVPVGRLDRNTTGLLLFTNDGDLAKKLTHPKYGIRKIYHVELNKNLKAEDFRTIQEGIMLEDGLIKVDDLSYLNNAPKREVGIEIHSGKNRIVRRIFEHLGYTVVKLDRVIFAGLTKKDLPRGHWRHLTQQEVINLGMLQ